MYANDSVLIEDWTFHNGMTALTLYSMDDGRLIARQYCPLGNQPLLALEGRKPGGALHFTFVSATNLPDPRADHNRSFDMLLDEDGTLLRHETYAENFEPETNGTRFTRIG